jgi:plasmid stabilization system protein ParE
VTPVTQLIISPKAVADLAVIGDGIAAAVGQEAADQFIHRVMTKVRQLARIPNAAGRPVPNLGEGLRLHAVGSYHVYMRYDDLSDTLVVVRVYHGRRKIARAHFRN